MPHESYIVSDPSILEGQPVIRGTRVTVRRLLLMLGQYENREALRVDYPQISDEAIREVLPSFPS